MAPLIQQSNLRYDGAIRVPQVEGFLNGGTGMCHNSAKNSLMLVGHREEALTAEISIPTPTKPSSGSQLPTAAFIQNFADVFDGKRYEAVSGVDGTYVGGLLVFQGSLVSNVYGFYDADNKQKKSHFRSGLNFSVGGDCAGPVTVGNLQPGKTAGYMGLVPPEWQSALGGPAVTGQSCLSITSRTNSGPGLSSFNPAGIVMSAPSIPSTTLLEYPLEHQPTSDIWVHGTTVRGVAIPNGSQSALFFGRKGTPPFCYGTGAECNDPTDPDKGYHSYPYKYWVWAYNLADFQAVKNGTKTAWSLKPYAMWELTLPFSEGSRKIESACFDPATNRIFIAVPGWGAGMDKPIIHILTVTGLTPSPTPSTPSNLRIVG